LIRSIRLLSALFIIALLPQTSRAQGGNGPTCTPCAARADSLKKAVAIDTNKVQNRRLASLEASRRGEEAQIDSLNKRIIVLTATQPSVDTSITNELARHRAELVKIEDQLRLQAELNRHQLAWNESESGLRGSIRTFVQNEPEKKTNVIDPSWFNRNEGWVIPTAVVVVATVWIGSRNHWFSGGGNDITNIVTVNR
jgi:hypothetical protein